MGEVYSPEREIESKIEETANQFQGNSNYQHTLGSTACQVSRDTLLLCSHARHDAIPKGRHFYLTWELREEDHEIKTDLSHTATLYQRKKNQELNVTVILVLGRHRQEEYTFQPSLHYIMNPGQPGLYKETLKTEGLGYSSVVEPWPSVDGGP